MLTLDDPVAAVYRATASLRGALAQRDHLTLRDQITITRIPAPTGEEEGRAQWIRRRFREIGLHDVRVDSAGNVIGRRHGLRDLPPVVVCAHMDTVFPRDTDLAVRVHSNRLYAPGIGDNSRGLAAMLAIAETLREEEVLSEGPIDFLASAGEEGSGDLRGAKYFFAEHAEAQAIVALDGPGDSRIINTALGCARLRVTFHGPGGHSWSAFGSPNPANAVGITTAILARVRVPAQPRSALSVSRLGGGISINCIPSNAWLEVDIRSTSDRVISALATEVSRAAAAATRNVNQTRAPDTRELEHEVELIGRRPCGELVADHPLVLAAVRATELIGRVPELGVASTDANVPLSRGIPAIAIGAGGRGGAAHSLDEWFENSDGALGITRAALIILSAAGLPGV